MAISEGIKKFGIPESVLWDRGMSGAICGECGMPWGCHNGVSCNRNFKESERCEMFKKGDRVTAKEGFGAYGALAGKSGIVVVTTEKSVGVEFDDKLEEGGHDCHGAGKAGHCRFGDPALLAMEGEAVKPRRKKAKEGPAEVVEVEESETWKMLYLLRDSPAVHRVLFYGPPGTGKTTAACQRENVYPITFHADSVVESLMGHYVPKGDAFEYHYGPAPLAMKEGAVLVANEIDHASGPIHSIMLNIMDDLEIATMLLPNGEVVKPKEGFRVFCTMNGDPSDLPVPLMDRFDVVLKVDHPSKAAVLRLPEDLRDLCVSAYSNRDKIPYTYRQIHAFSKLRGVVPEDKAGELTFGKQWRDIKTAIKIGKREV